MSRTEERKRELLKPPEIKPVLTVLLIFACMFGAGDGKIAWYQSHGVSAFKFFDNLNGKLGDLVTMCFTATFSQVSVWLFLSNILFIWLFSSRLERKILAWRYPVFLVVGIFAPWALLAYDVQFLMPDKLFLGPTMLTLYLMGAYLVYKPIKPFTPQEWVKPPWQVRKDDKAMAAQQKSYWVSPWLYIGAFSLYAAALQVLTQTPKEEITKLVNEPMLTRLISEAHMGLFGRVPAEMGGVLSPVSAMETVLLGAVVSFVLVSIVVKPQVKRSAGELQLQAVLQYKELRTLDMTHAQALEGTARLIGVPLDIVKDWIAKGVEMPGDRD